MIISVLQCGSEEDLLGHRVILACHSRMLREIFLSVDLLGQDCVLHLPDFSTQDVRILLDFLYGKLSLSASSRDLFKALDMEGSPLVNTANVGNRDESSPHPLVSTGLFGDYADGDSIVVPSDIETAEVLIDNNNFLTADECYQNLFCMLCNNGFTNEASLRDHLKQHPQCAACGIQFLRPGDLEEHWASCSGQRVEQSLLNDTFSIAANCDLGVDFDNLGIGKY